MVPLNRGVLIAIEGLDGSGKSTLSKKLHAALSAEALPVILTKEPGGTPLGQKLRGILQEKTVPVCPTAEYLLFATDRAQHFEELIIPALKNNQIIISDRMADSSLAYQGFGRRLDLNKLRQINAWVMNFIKPDITIYLEIPVQTAIERVRIRNEKLTSFEKENIEFMERIINGFSIIFKNRPDVLCLDGTQSQDAIAQQAIEKVTNWLHEKNIIVQ